MYGIILYPTRSRKFFPFLNFSKLQLHATEKKEKIRLTNDFFKKGKNHPHKEFSSINTATTTFQKNK